MLGLTIPQTDPLHLTAGGLLCYKSSIAPTLALWPGGFLFTTNYEPARKL